MGEGVKSIRFFVKLNNFSSALIIVLLPIFIASWLHCLIKYMQQMSIESYYSTTWSLNSQINLFTYRVSEMFERDGWAMMYGLFAWSYVLVVFLFGYFGYLLILSTSVLADHSTRNAYTFWAGWRSQISTVTQCWNRLLPLVDLQINSPTLSRYGPYKSLGHIDSWTSRTCFVRWFQKSQHCLRYKSFESGFGVWRTFWVNCILAPCTVFTR